ncbi:hypothetical protein BH20ACT2_BH20ACT2_12380 [soil metagenome]
MVSTRRSAFVPAPLVVAVLLLTVACSSGGDDEARNGSADGEVVRLDEPAPSATGEGGALAVAVRAVQVEPRVVILDLVVTNVAGESLLLIDEDDGPVLLDNRGGTYPARGEAVEIQGLTRERLRLEFAGPREAGVERLDLRFNPEFGSGAELAVDGLQVREGRRVEYASVAERSVALTDQVKYHPNGSSMVLYTITAGAETVEVTFLVVNGGDDPISLAGGGAPRPPPADDRPYLQDPSGRAYALLPDEANPELSVPAYQRLTGTLRFAGPLPPDVARVSLYVNGGQSANEFSRTPGFTFADLDLRS